MLSLVHAWIIVITSNALLYSLSQSIISAVQRIQNAAVRLLTGTKKFKQVLKSLHRLLVGKRINFKVLLLAPEYMRDLLQERINVQTLHCTDSSQLAVPQNRLKCFGDHAFSIAALRLWTALLGSITDCKLIDAFNISLTTYLFESAFSYV